MIIKRTKSQLLFPFSFLVFQVVYDERPLNHVSKFQLEKMGGAQQRHYGFLAGPAGIFCRSAQPIYRCGSDLSAALASAVVEQTREGEKARSDTRDRSITRCMQTHECIFNFSISQLAS